MFSETDRHDNEKTSNEAAVWLAGLMDCYDATAWQAPDCSDMQAPPAGESALDAIMRSYHTR